jgi:predicted AlkP superfamily phosphohydrolase/phosphomutase
MTGPAQANGRDASRRVVAIGLDAAELSLIERYGAAGELPNIAGLLRRSRFGELSGPDYPELAWAEILTGCRASGLGYASPLMLRPDYSVVDRGAYDFAVRPFYAHCRGTPVIVFDPPQARVAPQLEGVQIVGWGSHSPLGPSASEPPDRLAAIRAAHGEHPAFAEDWMLVTEGADKAERLAAAYRTGIERRARICRDLMREPWRLLIVAFGEPHAAGHALWHLSNDDHPARRLCAEPGKDPLRAVYEAVDRAVGEILEAAPDAAVVLFSSHGMKANSAELGTLVFLPELLYRRSFGAPALAAGEAALPAAPLERVRGDWARMLWASQRDANPLRRLLRRHVPLGVSRRLEATLGGAELALEHPFTSPLHYMPPLWYRPYWRRMPAFALPSFSDGFVRLNLRGRESAGLVEPSRYEALCDEIAAELLELKDARSGAAAVVEVGRSFSSAAAALAAAGDPGAQEADLVVRWSPRPIDVVDSPRFGRIGPVPFRQAGGHTARGFAGIAGSGIPAGRMATGRLIDIAPTIFDLLGLARPNHLEGASLLMP